MAIYGLFIGIDRFADPTIRELTGCRRDALALSTLFSDTHPELRSTLLVDNQATTNAVRAALTATLGAAGTNDTVIISLSSHGTRDHRLVTHDTGASNLPSSTIEMSELATLFKNSRARVVICILDCCFSGEAPARVFEDSPSPRSPTTPLDAVSGSGRILIAASGLNEPAVEHGRHGLLSFALIEALQASTDTVSLVALMDDVTHRVRAEAHRQGYEQNPAIFGHVEGGLILQTLRRGAQFFNAFPELKGRRISNKIEELAAFGLPAPLLASWQDLFPNGLNDLQLQAINDHRLLDGNSLFVVAPTSSGKTFIGELAAAKAIVDRRKAVFLFPYKALVNEKYDYFLETYGGSLGMRVIRCTGDYLDQTSQFLHGKYDLVLLTYEMYLSLSVAHPATLDSTGLIAVDELQFISNPRRGIAVELLLTNVLAARSRAVTPQVVTLSAVIGHDNDFSDWLKASKLITTQRPVPLVEGVMDRSGTFLYLDADGNKETQQLLPRHAIVQRKDKAGSQDVIVPLVKDILSQNPSERVIVFRNNRGSTEGCAQYLANELGLPPADDVLEALPNRDLSTSSQSLRKSLAGGTAFHNANLSREERVVVERGFRKRDGKVKVLAATTTVAAGINTPASTVILAEQEFIGEENQPFTVAEYKNMAGRAGRVGYHETGRAIILADTAMEQRSLFQKYVLGYPEPLTSSFAPSELDTWILRLLSQVKRVPRDGVVTLLASTYGGYLATKADPSWHTRITVQLSTLLTQMIELGLVEEETGTVHLTILGRACGRSSLSFRSAMRLVRLLRSRAGTQLSAEHLMASIQALPELDDVYTPLMKRGQAENRWPQETASRFGRAISHGLQAQAEDNFAYCARCKRTMILAYWISGMPIESIEREMTTNAFQGKIGAGHVRGIADATRFHFRSAAEIAATVLLDEAPAPGTVDSLLKQLETGLPADALDLLALPLLLDRGEYLGLIAAGARSPAHLVALPLDALEAIVGKMRAQQLLKWS